MSTYLAEIVRRPAFDLDYYGRSNHVAYIEFLAMSDKAAACIAHEEFVKQANHCPALRIKVRSCGLVPHHCMVGEIIRVD